MVFPFSPKTEKYEITNLCQLLYRLKIASVLCNYSVALYSLN